MCSGLLRVVGDQSGPHRKHEASEQGHNFLEPAHHPLSSHKGQLALCMTSTHDVNLSVPAPSDPTWDALAADHPVYVDYCRRAAVLAAEAGLVDMEQLDLVRKAGVDKEGRDVYMFFPGNLPQGVDLDKVTMYVLRLMHDSVVRAERPFTAVWVCNNMLDSQLSFWWFRRTYKMLPHAYKKQMRCLCIVHPSIQVRMLLLLLSYVVKHSFWEKLVYADRIECVPPRPCTRHCCARRFGLLCSVA